VVSTEQGNENSKANVEEAKEVVSCSRLKRCIWGYSVNKNLLPIKLYAVGTKFGFV